MHSGPVYELGRKSSQSMVGMRERTRNKEEMIQWSGKGSRMTRNQNQSIYLARIAGPQVTKEARRASAARKSSGIENQGEFEIGESSMFRRSGDAMEALADISNQQSSQIRVSQLDAEKSIRDQEKDVERASST